MKPIPLGPILGTGPEAPKRATAAAPYQLHSSTSKDAAEAIAGHLSAQEAKVMDAFTRYRDVVNSGLTDEQCQDHTGLAPSSQRPRRIAMTQRGLLKDSGLTRQTASGRSATVWVLAS